MRYSPRLRSPVSGSRVTTQGNVRNRPPSSGQHFRIGRSRRDGGLESRVVGSSTSGALGQGAVRGAGASNRWMTSLHAPVLARLGLAWRRVSAWPSSAKVSRMPVGGLAWMSEPSSAATASTLSAPSAMAMRLAEPMVLMATRCGETRPLTVGCSMSSARPPSGFFISRSANSVISNSVASGWLTRVSSPACSRASRNAAYDS